MKQGHEGAIWVCGGRMFQAEGPARTNLGPEQECLRLVWWEEMERGIGWEPSAGPPAVGLCVSQCHQTELKKF